MSLDSLTNKELGISYRIAVAKLIESGGSDIDDVFFHSSLEDLLGSSNEPIRKVSMYETYSK